MLSREGLGGRRGGVGGREQETGARLPWVQRRVLRLPPLGDAAPVLFVCATSSPAASCSCYCFFISVGGALMVLPSCCQVNRCSRSTLTSVKNTT